MKRILYAALLVFGMSLMFCSCEKGEGGESGGISQSFLTGCWAVIDDYNTVDAVADYFEFGKNGILTHYELQHVDLDVMPSLNNGTLYSPANATWVQTEKAEYKLDEGFLMIGIFSGRVNKLDKDTFVCDIWSRTTFYRIKQFKTK